MAISLKFYLVVLLTTILSRVIYTFTVARVVVDTGSAARKEREIIDGLRKCPKGKIWYYTQCMSIKQIQHENIVITTKTDLFPYSAQTGESVVEDTLESNKTLSILPLSQPNEKHSDITVTNSSATLLQPKTSNTLAKSASAVDVMTEPLPVLPLTYSNQKQSKTKETAIDPLSTSSESKEVETATDTVKHTESTTSDTEQAVDSTFMTTSTRTMTTTNVMTESLPVFSSTHSNQKQSKTKETATDPLSTPSESKEVETATVTVKHTEYMTSDTEQAETSTNIDTTELTPVVTKSDQTTSFVHRKKTHTKFSGTHIRNEYMANILGETQALISVFLLVGFCVAVLNWLYERLYAMFCHRTTEDLDEIDSETISIHIKN